MAGIYTTGIGANPSLSSSPSIKPPPSIHTFHTASFNPSRINEGSETPLYHLLLPPSKTRLSKSTLRHLRQLKRVVRPRKSPPGSVSSSFIAKHARSIAHFASHGGPDLRSLRDYNTQTTTADEMSERTPTEASITDGQTKNRNSSAYNSRFSVLIRTHGIRPEYNSEPPANLASIHDMLSFPLPPLLVANLDERFKMYRRNLMNIHNETEIRMKILPLLLSSEDISDSSQDILFNDLDKIIDADVVQPWPDMFAGSMADGIDERVLRPSGTIRTAKSQIRYYGAYGARAMHAIQNYGNTTQEYDGNAYTFSAMYLDSFLNVYAHHVSKPRSEGLHQYHTTLVHSVSMVHSKERFAEGVRVLHNVNELAKRYRNDFINQANERVPATTAPIDPAAPATAPATAPTAAPTAASAVAPAAASAAASAATLPAVIPASAASAAPTVAPNTDAVMEMEVDPDNNAIVNIQRIFNAKFFVTQAQIKADMSAERTKTAQAKAQATQAEAQAAQAKAQATQAEAQAAQAKAQATQAKARDAQAEAQAAQAAAQATQAKARDAQAEAQAAQAAAQTAQDVASVDAAALAFARIKAEATEAIAKATHEQSYMKMKQSGRINKPLFKGSLKQQRRSAIEKSQRSRSNDSTNTTSIHSQSRMSESLEDDNALDDTEEEDVEEYDTENNDAST